MTRLIVVRHGRSTANDAGVFSCMRDVALSPIGEQQAVFVAKYLAQNERIGRIYASGMKRTAQTAMPTAEHFHLPVETECGLREIFAGLWEGLPYKELNRRFHADWMNWLYDFSNARCTEGESVRELYRRICNTVRRIAEENDGKTVMLTTHYTPLRIIAAWGMGLSPEQLHLSPPSTNASISIFHYEDGILQTELSNLIPYPDALLSTNAHPFPPKLPKKA